MRFVNDDTVRVAFISNSDVITSTSAGAQVPALSGAGLNITGNQDSVVGLSLAVGSSNGLAIGEGTAFDGNVSDSNNVGTLIPTHSTTIPMCTSAWAMSSTTITTMIWSLWSSSSMLRC
jgi:hypothetical protein